MGSQPAPSALPPSLPPHCLHPFLPPSWASAQDLGVWASNKLLSSSQTWIKEPEAAGRPGFHELLYEAVGH